MTTILLTRPRGAGDPLVAELESRNYRVIALPVVMVRQLAVDWPDLSGFDWIVVTSAAGVEALPSKPRGPRLAAVGRATASALHAKGLQADLVPADANGAALGDALPAAGKRVLLVRGSLADSDLPTLLRRRGASVQEVTAYETLEGPDDAGADLRRACAETDLAAVVFASGSAVRGFLKLGGSVAVPAVTIGPRTTAVAKAAGFNVLAEAAAPDVHELAAAVARAIPIEVAKDA